MTYFNLANEVRVILRNILGIFWVAASSNLFASPLTFKGGSAAFHAQGSPGKMNIHGRGGQVTGTLERTGKLIKGELRCQMNGFKVSGELMDAQIKERYLRVKEFPESILKLESFETNGAGVAVRKPFNGKLTLLGVEKPVSGMASLSKDGELVAEMSLSMAEFGVGPVIYAAIKVLDKVNLKVQGKVSE